MNDHTQSGMPCSEFDALLMEAVEGSLNDEQMQRFRLHAEQCGVCGPLFADAQAGFSWLRSLEPVEPPANLVHNILAATSEQDVAMKKAPMAVELSASDRLRKWFSPFLQPRMAGTFAMAFFSLTLLLNVTGVRLGSLRKADLRPSAMMQEISKTYYATTSRVTRYYQNLRFVYEVESKVRELKQVIPAEEQKNESKPEDKDKKQQNNKKQDRSSNPSGHSATEPGERDNAERFRQENNAMEMVALRGANLPSLTAARLKQSNASSRVLRNELNRRTA